MKMNSGQEFYEKNGFPSYLDALPREVVYINGKKYWKFDFECKEAKKMDLSAIQKLFYPVKNNGI